MKNLILVICLVFFQTHAFSQTHTETFQGCGASYTVTAEMQSNKSYKIQIKADSDNLIEYEIRTNNFEIFGNMFKERFLSKFDPQNTCTDASKNTLLLYGNRLFTSILAANTDDDENSIPIAGTISVNNAVKLYASIKGAQYAKTADEYKIKKVDIEINDGFIENIIAYIIVNNKQLIFTNFYAIGFSSITNFKNISSIRLYESHSSPLNETKDPQYYVKLNDLIAYEWELGLNRRDYSPKNERVIIKGNEKMTLYKEETKKLFEAHIYADFVGVDRNKPNGLIQSEINKKIVINTVQFQTGKSLFRVFKSYGFLSYIRPEITISKIEEHNKELPLGDLDSIRNLDPSNPGIKTSLHRFATALDLFQYQNFSAGITGNILSLSNHDLKYNFYLNIGAKLGITQVADSLTSIDQNQIMKTGFVDNYSVNTLQFFPEAILNFLPEERFNLLITDRLSYFKVANEKIQTLSFLKQDVAKVSPKSSNWINTFEMLMTIQVNPNSKLFGRVRFNSDLKDIHNNFKQIQLGYSTYILGNK